jgi:peptidoglycan hydrolase-like protein with peptidoglycan-binding domain
MQRLVRRLLPILVASLALGITAPTVAAAAPRFPTQSLGDRGTNVQTLQWLVNGRGHPVTVDGIFGATTVTAIKALQTADGLPVTGIVDDDTWRTLVLPRSLGDTGAAVKAIQRELRAKRHIAVPLDAIYGASTKAGVKTFQAHEGIPVTGKVDGVTWRYLVAHFELPVFNTTSLCDYSVGNGPANWATSEAIATVEAAAKVEAAAGYGRVAVGDAGFQYGGNIPLHETHERGLDVDLRLMRKANDQCKWGTNYRMSTYDRKATRALIKAIRAASPGHIKLIYFNDPVLIEEGLTVHFPGHDDHLHVRFCENGYPLAMYRC